MNQRRRIFFAIFGIYHLSLFVFTYYLEINKNDWGFLSDLFSGISYYKWGALLGLFMVIIDFIWNWIETRNAGIEKEAMRHENNTLKAKVYDLQQPTSQSIKESPSGGKF